MGALSSSFFVVTKAQLVPLLATTTHMVVALQGVLVREAAVRDGVCMRPRSECVCFMGRLEGSVYVYVLTNWETLHLQPVENTQ